MSASRLLVVGATGDVGGAVLSQLLQLSPVPSIRVSSRDPSRAHFPPSVEVVQADLTDPSSFPRLFHGIDRAFLYVQRGAPLPELLSVAKAEGVRHIVLNSSSAVERAPDGPIGKLHATAERAVLDSGLAYTFIRGGSYANSMRLWGWAGQIKAEGAVDLVYPDSPLAPVAEDDLAAAAVLGLTTDRMTNRSAIVSGPELLTQRAMMETISEVRQADGKPPVTIRVVSAEEWKAKRGEALSSVMPGLADMLLKRWKALADEPWKGSGVEELTGKPGTSFRHWVEKNRDMFE